ncbi:GNAT family N-acetyltransferase [Pseudonocardia hispaniensis]|uniref:GNAT family N-acetyltransferase n=1 Tax=Pseudonocardia hispaniensis TaxID=904933 RepID=A0ABW1J1C3_9PSEU
MRESVLHTQPGCRALAPAADLRYLRATTHADCAAVVELVGACSPQTLGRRFLLPGIDATRVLGGYLRFLLPASGGEALLASVDGCPAGLLTVFRYGPCRAEIALLVPDRWQRRGIGTQLVRFARGALAGRRIHATVHSTNVGSRALLRLLGQPLQGGASAPGQLDYEFVLSPDEGDRPTARPRVRRSPRCRG